MKRGREEDSEGPPSKRPMNARLKNVGPVRPPGVSQRLTTDDALDYLKSVREMFQDRTDKYDEFLKAMRDFKAQRLDTKGVIAKVKELFKGHRNLILGFNTFLPKGYEITVSDEAPPKKQPVELSEAINYVNKIKARFRQNEDVYKVFLEILDSYRRGNKSINEVYQDVATLFREHHDLLEEFRVFLPESKSTLLPKATSIRREEKMTALVNPKHTLGEKLIKKEKASNIQVDCDKSSERIERDEEEGVLVKGEKEHHRKQAEMEKNERKDERERKEREKKIERVVSEQEYDEEADGCFIKKRKSARRADELIHKQSQAGDVLNGSVPTSVVEEKKVPQIFQGEMAFLEKIKSRLGKNTYMGFMKCLNLFSEDVIDRPQLHKLIDELLNGYPDLVEGFSDFLSRCEKNEELLTNAISKGNELQPSVGPVMKQLKLEKERDKEEEKEKEKEREKEREKKKEKEKEKEKERGKEKDQGVEREREKDREREKLSSVIPKDAPNHKVSILSSKETYTNKPVSELDLSNCERCTPSYRMLPKNYSLPMASHCTDLAHTVLNDNWVSVTSGSEDYSFKHMRKNQYEESLFRCEDDRFELDMILESTAATAKHLEELLEKGSSKSKSQICLEDHLTAINLRCIERVYGDHGVDAVDLLRKNTTVAVPVILARLKQKRDEWTKCRSEMNKVWAEVYAKNYYKSLDHRSFYFKQQDKKNLSTKGLLSEVKEINDKKSLEDDAILSIAAGKKRPLIPDLQFDYPDPTIFEDMYQIIKYSSDEMCTSMEQSNKIMHIWTDFLEPIFGVPSRFHNAEDAEEFSKKISPKVEHNSTSSVDRSDYIDVHIASSVVEMKHETSATTMEEINKADGMERQWDKSFYATLIATAEREEGELSPSPEVEDRENAKYDVGDDEALRRYQVSRKSLKNKCFGDIREKREEHLGCEQAKVVGDDDEEESVRKNSEESDNASQGGEEVSGTESVECSHEDNNEVDEEEGKVESECEGASSDHSLLSCRPLEAHSLSLDPSCSGGDLRIFYGNDTFYVLFRLHQTFYERMLSAKTNANAAEHKWKATRDTPPPDLHARFMQTLYNLLDGSVDNAKFEDDCRAIIGTQSYVLFTIDKLIFKIVKQLQAIVSDDVVNKLLALHSYEKSRPHGSLIDDVYHANSTLLLQGKNIYRFENDLNPNQLRIQLMESGSEKSKAPQNPGSSPLSRYLNDILLSVPDIKGCLPVFLSRNKRVQLNGKKENENESIIKLIMRDVSIANGLEHRILFNTSKIKRVSYVVHTEDFLYRRKKKATQTGGSSRRVARFHKLVEKDQIDSFFIHLEGKPFVMGTSNPELRATDLPKGVLIEHRD